MSQLKNAFNRQKHKDVAELKHKALEIFISFNDIFEANAKYSQGEYKVYVNDQFKKKHGVLITDFEKLVFYTTVDDKIMKITGHKGYSLTEPVA